jgi:hypothetical protein
MKEVDGLVNAKRPKPPAPKPSPKDFVWPPQSDHDDAVAKKIATSLQELLPARDWTHSQLARELWGTDSEGKVRNIAKARGWLVGDHPIPNLEHAGYLAQVLDVSLARLLEPEGKFDPHPPLIRTRSPNGVNLAKMGKRKKKTMTTDKTPSGRDREKQRAYNAAYRARQRKKRAGSGELSYYMRKKLEKQKGGKKRNGHNGAENGATWALPEGVDTPEFVVSSEQDHPGLVTLEVKATLPHQRAMAIIHILQSETPPEK